MRPLAILRLTGIVCDGRMNSFHEPTPGRAHWVYTHPRHDSLNRHLIRAGSAALSEQYEVTVSDLYADGFDPALSERDLGGLSGVPETSLSSRARPMNGER